MADADSTPAPKRKRKHKTHGPDLTAAEVRFCLALFAGKSRYDAYVEAGCPPCPNRVATDSAAYRLVKKRQIRTYLRDLQQRAADAAQVDANAVVQGLKRIAFSKLPDLYDARGRIKLPHEWPADLVGAVESVESEELFEFVDGTDPDTGKRCRRKELVGYVRKVKVAKRIEALRLLAEIVRLTGRDADAGKPPPAPLVVGGDANPDAL